LAGTPGKITPQKIPVDQIVPSSPTPLTGDKGFCTIQSDNDTSAYYIGSFGAGDGVALYMDPATCGVQVPYPFKVTDVHFYLLDFTGAVWPVEIQVNIKDLIQGYKCNGPNGPGNILCSQTYTIPIDSAYPIMIHLDLDSLCCVYAPFFLEIIYGGTSSPYPSLVLTNGNTNPTDTCDAWVLWGGSYQEWYVFFGLGIGYPMMRITGYTNSMDCDPCWYWKPDRPSQEFPAPSGMPDFGQYQFGPSDSIGLCGPTAVANCLWWFNAVPPGVSPDSLIRLLSTYFHTHPDSGTYVDSIKSGLDRYFSDYPGFNLYAHVFTMPQFREMEDSLKKSQDIILLLGFWQLFPIKDVPPWSRFGGHYVTMAGVCSESAWVALSDPAWDMAESGHPGRVRPPGHPSHMDGDTLHNYPQYVSHDIYQAILQAESPGGFWEIDNYYYLPDKVIAWSQGQNFQPEQLSYYNPYMPSADVYTEVEYAIMICPKPTAVEEEEEEGSITPKDFELYQSYPNPFNNQTIIKYDLLKPCQVTLTIYNILGQKVKTLVEGYQEAGTKIINWDGKDEKDKDLASGIYFYQLRAGEVTQTKRMVLLK
ncbi:MAG: T9SS type A sorting domain-containing protein, partial [candidate division Zixibacteria bacterium]|nr:T9SS type A sorting domain-containing protein [candidate division Zixibacteria bacterium]